MKKHVGVECADKITSPPGSRQYFRQKEEAHHRFAMMRHLPQQRTIVTLL